MNIYSIKIQKEGDVMMDYSILADTDSAFYERIIGWLVLIQLERKFQLNEEEKASELNCHYQMEGKE